MASRVSWSSVSPRPSPMSAWGGIVQATYAAGSSASATSPPATRKHPVAVSTVVEVGRRASQRPGEQRRERHDRDGHRGDHGRLTPAVDQEQHDQEERSGQCRREQQEREVRPERRTVAVGHVHRRGPDRQRGRHGEHRDRHLHDEDRLPGEGCGEQPADHRAGRRTHHPRRHPGRDAAPLVGRRDEQLEAAHERERPADPLQAAGADQHLHRPAERAQRRGTGEQRDPRRGERRRVATLVRPRGRHDGDREHQVERDEHPRHLGDGAVQLLQDVGQRERDDRGVGEHERDSQREQGHSGATHGLIVTRQPRLTVPIAMRESIIGG